MIVAGCVITDDYDRILLLHRNSSSSSWWELPGGQADEDELPETAAVRAVSETLGVSATLTRSLGNAVYEDDEEVSVYWFRARLIGREPDIIDDGEYDDLAYFDMEDMMGLALSASTGLLMEKIYNGEVAIGDDTVV